LDFAPLLAAGLLAAASVQHTDAARIARIVAQDNAVAVTTPGNSQHGVPEPPAIGSPAPDFTYQSFDYQWRNLHHMLAQGNVLLVFGASDENLRALERDSETLLMHEVVPVAVVGQRESEVWRTVRRCGLTYSLLADPHTAIAEQFGAVDAAHHAAPAWFVIDPSGRVRGAGKGMPPASDWLAVAGSSLGLTDIARTGAR
jgi:peroxiredoxin